MPKLEHLRKSFPGTLVYICNFYREQAWTRWIHNMKHGLSHEDGNLLLEMLRDCAWAPVDQHYQEVFFNLEKKSCCSGMDE